MSQIISTGNFQIIHWVIVIGIICEYFNFAERNIFRDFEGIIISISSGQQRLGDLKKNEQKGSRGQVFSLNRVIRAYSVLYVLKLLSSIAIGISVLLALVTHFDYIFEDFLSIMETTKWLWEIVFFLDITLLLLRGRSKIAHILQALHPRYSNTRVLVIISWLYLIRK